MEVGNYRDSNAIVGRLRQQAEKNSIRVTIHGHQEMVAENISYEALREALLESQVIENYPCHQRGACCLICDRARSGQYLHLVCTTDLEIIVVITVYEPKLPKWATPFQRGGEYEM
jgi:hypothetical protein